MKHIPPQFNPEQVKLVVLPAECGLRGDQPFSPGGIYGYGIGTYLVPEYSLDEDQRKAYDTKASS